jgi:hypothetical protein
MTFKYDEELPVALGALCVYAVFAFAMVLYITGSNGADTNWTTSFYCAFTAHTPCTILIQTFA